MTKIVPLLSLPVDQVQAYWQTLHMHDTLKYRLGDVTDPQWDSVVHMITRMGNQMYCVIDENDGQIVGEFALDNYNGEASQIHFSTHPENGTVYNLAMVAKTLEEIVTWPKLSVLYGLTPVLNRIACLFVLKVGFKKLGILPKSSHYLGEVSDSMISVMVR